MFFFHKTLVNVDFNASKDLNMLLHHPAVTLSAGTLLQMDM